MTFGSLVIQYILSLVRLSIRVQIYYICSVEVFGSHVVCLSVVKLSQLRWLRVMSLPDLIGLVGVLSLCLSLITLFLYPYVPWILSLFLPLYLFLSKAEVVEGNELTRPYLASRRSLSVSVHNFFLYPSVNDFFSLYHLLYLFISRAEVSEGSKLIRPNLTSRPSHSLYLSL